MHVASWLGLKTPRQATMDPECSSVQLVSVLTSSTGVYHLRAYQLQAERYCIAACRRKL